MKRRILLCTFLVVLSVCVYGEVTVYCYETQDVVNMNQLDVAYCEVVVSEKPFARNVKVVVDFGDGKSFIAVPSLTEIPGKPKKKEFYSRVQVLNYMEDNGWEVVTSSVSYTPRNYDDFHYILKRKV